LHEGRALQATGIEMARLDTEMGNLNRARYAAGVAN
jgi:hypothetical protein